MEITYNSKTDLLYIRFDQHKQSLINKKVKDNVVLDIGRGNKIVGIEIMDASKNVSLDQLLTTTKKTINKIEC